MEKAVKMLKYSVQHTPILPINVMDILEEMEHAY